MTEKKYTLSTSNVIDDLQLYGLVVLRVLIGWHFLYEGVSKLMRCNKSTAGRNRGPANAR